MAIKKENVKQKDIEEHLDELLEKKLDEKVKDLIEQIPQETNNQNEMNNSIRKGMQKLIKMMESNTEFYPSLNPPTYIVTSEKGFSVNYNSLQKAVKTANKNKQVVENPVKAIEDRKEEDDG